MKYSERKARPYSEGGRVFYSICTMSRCEVQLIRAESMKDINADRYWGLEGEEQYSKRRSGSRGYTVSLSSSRIYDFVVIYDAIDESVVSDGLFRAGGGQDLVFCFVSGAENILLFSVSGSGILVECALLIFPLKTNIYTKHGSTSPSRLLNCIKASAVSL